jgi:hypothetical protein
MNKKILVLAFVSAAFFFGCSADGSFNSGEEPPAWKGAPSTTVLGGYCLLEGVCGPLEASICQSIGGTVVGSCPTEPPIQGPKYCLYDNFRGGHDCDLIGGNYTGSEEECISENNGTVVSRQQCVSIGADIFDE